jgi:GNAT superfamily N-acetyltransferase
MPNSNIRPITAADRKYVIQSYLYDYKESPAMTFPGLINDDYFGYQHKLIEDFLPRASRAGSAYIMCEPGQDHLYRGWLIAEPYENLPVVHFLKVKKGAQGQGVATALMEKFYSDFGYAKGINCVYTHGTKDMKKRWLADKMTQEWRCVFLPYFATTLADPGWEK